MIYLAIFSAPTYSGELHLYCKKTSQRIQLYIQENISKNTKHLIKSKDKQCGYLPNQWACQGIFLVHLKGLFHGFLWLRWDSNSSPWYIAQIHKMMRTNSELRTNSHIPLWVEGLISGEETLQESEVVDPAHVYNMLLILRNIGGEWLVLLYNTNPPGCANVRFSLLLDCRMEPLVIFGLFLFFLSFFLIFHIFLLFQSLSHFNRLCILHNNKRNKWTTWSTKAVDITVDVACIDEKLDCSFCFPDISLEALVHKLGQYSLSTTQQSN